MFIIWQQYDRILIECSPKKVEIDVIQLYNMVFMMFSMTQLLMTGNVSLLAAPG